MMLITQDQQDIARCVRSRSCRAFQSGLLPPIQFRMDLLHFITLISSISILPFVRSTTLCHGCEVLTNKGSNTSCSCSNLTEATVLNNHRDMKSVNHEEILTHVIRIGLSVSLFFLAICIFTFIYFRSLQSIRTSIHTNLCICLFASQLTFLVGIDLIERLTACSIIAGVLHYFLLSTFTWMALEGVQLYVMLVEVFEKHTRIIWYYIAGYGLPAVFVSLNAGLNSSGYGTESVCWLTRDSNRTAGATPFIWSFIAPVSFLSLGNLGFILLTASMLCRRGRRFVFYSRIQAIKGALKGAFTLLLLLATTWIFGFLWCWKGMLALQYLFCILNAFQGIHIFIFYCLLQKKVRCEYRKMFKRCRDAEHLSPTTSIKVKYSSNKIPSCDRSRYKQSSSQRDGNMKSSYRDDNRKTSLNLHDASKYFSTQDRASMKILFAQRESQATPYLPTDIKGLNETLMRTFSTRSCPGSDSPNRKRHSSTNRDVSPFKRCMSERKHFRGKYSTPVTDGVTRILKSAASNHSIVPCRYLPAKAWENGTPDSTCTRSTTLSKDVSTLQSCHVPVSPSNGQNSFAKIKTSMDATFQKCGSSMSSPTGLNSSSKEFKFASTSPLAGQKSPAKEFKFFSISPPSGSYSPTLQRYHVPISPPPGPNSPTKEFKLVDKRVAKLKKMNSSPSLGLGRSSSWNAAEKKRRPIQRRLEDQPSTSVPDLMTQLSQKIESRDISLVLLNYLDADGTLNKQKLDEARQLGNL